MKKANGFTVVELLVVITVIVILAALSVVAYVSMQDEARASATEADISTVARGLEAYHARSGSHPKSLDEMSSQMFGSVEKMNWGRYSNEGPSTPKGHYKVTDTATGLRVYFYDYREQKWTTANIHDVGTATGGRIEYGDMGMFDPRDGGPCRQELLENCSQVL